MKWPIVAIVTLSSFSVAVLKPEWLAKNTFLANLVSYELVSILIVILTVTMGFSCKHSSFVRQAKKVIDGQGSGHQQTDSWRQERIVRKRLVPIWVILHIAG
ncbi:hypothetical protein [Mesorhizobium sp. B2-8-9]|uniref:hypothetical protein n=1 Tax=Mesorhizobium sp. B2-8-9 TaxID=2589899 RepID=UPI00112E9375|nr:hypothetical protein [Mesorhizobium sp. B2-8-9]TPI85234.1 hypothetical protein FJ423_02570 [Mesorhizobium sp. B2-8-9]